MILPRRGRAPAPARPRGSSDAMKQRSDPDPDARDSAREQRLLEYFRGLPKVELHIHLEGAVPLACVWDLIRKYGGDPGVPDLESLAGRFRYRDFAAFLDTWAWKNGFFRTGEDFTRIAAAVAADLAAQSILYAELFYSPQSYASRGLGAQEITLAVRRGLDQVPAIEIALVTDLVRDLGARSGREAVEAVSEVREAGRVVGIGIGGSEHRFPPEPYAPVFARARELGFRTTAHAGEACGPESVWGALRALRVERLGHATRAAEDPALLDHLAAERIALELCVISNLRTGVVPSAERHPARRYFERGIPLSVNTDDPLMFGNSLAEEYLLLHRALGFSLDEIHALIDSAVAASWLPDARKSALGERIRQGMARCPRPE